MSLTEKSIFSCLIAVLAIGMFILISKINEKISITVPKQGGTLIEGLIGSPRFVNPLLSLSDADRDLTSLVYSGLLKVTPEGELAPDLAASYNVSESGLEYRFTLKDNIYFQDGHPVTADDFIFTIQKAQDPNLKSPRRASFEGVTTEKLNDREIKINLKQPYAPFLENMTLGVLPKHLWKDIEPEQFPFSELNVKPVGSGPYSVNKVNRDSSGVPLSYTLSAFKKYDSGAPFVKKIIFRFFANEERLLDAYGKGEIQAANSISPDKAPLILKLGGVLVKSPLPRVFGVFFNQNQTTIFADREVRAALDKAINKKLIVEEILRGYGTPLDSPIPPDVFLKTESSTTPPDFQGDEKTAKDILLKAGWKLNAQEGVLEKKTKASTEKLSFSLATSNAAELKAVAELIKVAWERLGAKVELKIFEPGDLNQNVIRPRKYDALLFGEIVGRDLDLFAFWHSSQRNDPGLNIALYTNIKTDKLLEEARTIQDNKVRLKKYEEFEAEIKREIPVVFLYAPDFIYAVPKKIKGLKISRVTVPADRFLRIEKWFIETEKVWRIFAK